MMFLIMYLIGAIISPLVFMCVEFCRTKQTVFEGSDIIFMVLISLFSWGGVFAGCCMWLFECPHDWKFSLPKIRIDISRWTK